jgi:hypothetical protein
MKRAAREKWKKPGSVIVEARKKIDGAINKIVEETAQKMEAAVSEMAENTLAELPPYRRWAPTPLTTVKAHFRP